MKLRRNDTPDGRWVTVWVIAADGRYLSMKYRADLTTVQGGRRLIADDIRALRRELRAPWTEWAGVVREA